MDLQGRVGAFEPAPVPPPAEPHATATRKPVGHAEPTMPGRPAGAQPIVVAQQELPSPVPLMALSTGFWAFKTLAAAHELDLFSRLSGGASTTSLELARALGIHPRPAEMLLTGCAALGLLEKADGRYRNSPMSEESLVRGKPHSFGGWV
jgi:hypothetical protein